jgi:hypothetical protein
MILPKDQLGGIGKFFSTSVSPILFITLIHIGTFWGHYTSRYIFPWDFVSSAYHSQAVVWYRDGSVFNPPSWLPYGSMGFPAWWSLQSGAWYLPLQISSWAGIHYTFFNAASFQAVHVLVGAIGVFYLLRAENFGRTSACLGALVFHFSSIFFSNAQHTDIIRSAALLPVLLHAIHPNTIKKNALTPAWASVVIFQFLIASYPGNVVSSFYTSLICVYSWFFQQPVNARFGYFLKLAIAGISGLLMAQLKLFTPILEAYTSYNPKLGVLGLHADHLLTFLFTYDLSNLTQDPTMRSLWSPPAALILVFFLASAPKKFAVPIFLFTTSITFASLDSISPYARSLIPGLE